ncbi:PhzF family phenazine biosynthesis protein [Polluticoccus soli]|uniref:PhzF family phenazine biosynthesis protein n=1 Tax=Polluticoccus soli TaxID=3034150 RepID=UPI0023E20F00|nr:PhzF family phenazine biosynthesis isomerase [Flavipsychrobacter sp. JY13-12]
MKQYIVDAFTDELFSGNPAAVCILDKWLPDKMMQRIAAENNLAETAFLTPVTDGFHIRWFTPAVEVDLCGHATLASAHVLFNHERYQGNKIVFDSRSGQLIVLKSANLTLDFPVDKIEKVSNVPLALTDALSQVPTEVYRGKTDYMAVYSSQSEIEQLDPDFRVLAKLDGRGVIVTAPGDTIDFVSRFFAPQSGIDEDPVTGSAHTSLAPYWASKLGKEKFSCLQLSARGGKLFCELVGDRVKISGNAVTYSIADILINTN